MLTQLKDNTIILNGMEQGIADNPYDGIADIRNMNILSVQKEASVNFATQNNGPINVGATTIVSANGTNKTITLSQVITNFMCVTFTGASLPTGLSPSTNYWLQLSSGTTYTVYSDPWRSTQVNVSANGTGTVNLILMGQPTYSTTINSTYLQSIFVIDINGRVWTQISNSFVYLGNTTDSTSHGNGIVNYYSNINASANTYIFIFRDFQIDYCKINSNSSYSTLTWVYGWNPATGTSGNTDYLKSYISLNVGYAPNPIHQAIVGADNAVYYCDGTYIGRWSVVTNGPVFDPLLPNTNYIFDQTALLPNTDTAQCITLLNGNLLVGGNKNVIYVWDRKSLYYSSFLFVSESNIQNMVTVNSDSFIFAGNRGRIYVTNGSRVDLYKKIPDHITGAIEPYYIWGGATSLKNQLYFSFNAITNYGALPTPNLCGGIWAIDLSSQSYSFASQTTSAAALRMTSQLSFGTYAGYATLLTQNIDNNNGAGIVAGWYDGVSSYGIDISSPSLATTGTIDFDFMNIGTFLEPKTINSIQFKLSTPMLSGETFKLQYRQNLTSSFQDIDSTVTFGSGVYSGAYQSLTFQNSQWLQLRAVFSIITSSPSGIRLTEIRIK